MLIKRRLLVSLTFFMVCAAWASLPKQLSLKQSPTTNILSLEPSVALAASPPFASGPVRLIATDGAFPLEGPLAELTPTNITTTETLETPVVASLSALRNSDRTHLLIALNGSHAWQQVPSTAPYRFTGAYRLTWTSQVLPSPGSFSFGVGFDGQIENEASTKTIAYLRDPIGCAAFDEKVLAPLMKFNFPDLTEEQVVQLARRLIRSEILIEMKVRVTMRSVDAFTLNNAFLQVWGD